MAASTVAATNIILNGPRIAGPVQQNQIPPKDASGAAFTNSTHHNVAVPAYKVGEIYEYQDPGQVTPTRFQYLKAGTESTTIAVAAGSVCTLVAGSAEHIVANAPDVHVANAPVVIALSAMTLNFYGWYWISGPCPSTLVAALATATCVTDGNSVQGAIACLDTATTDVLGFGAVASALNACGVALAADA